MSLFTVAELETSEISVLLDHAEEYRLSASTTVFHGTSVASLFFEASTRTRLSFELAASRLGSQVVSFDPETSSGVKGESFKDTVQTVAAMGVDLIVLRHSDVGAPEKVLEWTGRPVVNAGDGRRGHPTQTLADLLTIRHHFGDLRGVRLGLVGDIANSRVARGLIDAMPRMGGSVELIGPPNLLPMGSSLPTGHSLDDALPELDVVYLLRVQKERGANKSYPSDSEYRRRFGLTAERVHTMKPDAVIMHPGPVNRGVEIEDSVVDSDRALILAQVTNGVLARMAVLAAELGGN